MEFVWTDDWRILGLRM